MAKKPDETVVTNPNQSAAVTKSVAEIEKKYGKGAITTLTNDAVVRCDVISTGEPTIDLALGVMGVPRGRVIEIFGPESSGKTTLTLHILAQAQKIVGKQAAFIDAEHALDPQWAKRIGVKLDELFVCQPDTGEQALDIVEILTTGGGFSCIVIDSVAALVPKAEIDGEMGDSHIGLQARMLSQAMRKLSGVASKTGTTIIFINQIREKIGVMFGNPETTPGGRALKFYASIRIDIRKTGAVKQGEVQIGNKTKIKIVKNKVAPPFRLAEPTIYFGDPVSGFDASTALIEMGVANGVVEKSGSWYNFNAIRLGNGLPVVASFLRSNPDLYEELRAAIWAIVAPKKIVDALPDQDEGVGFDEDGTDSEVEALKLPPPTAENIVEEELDDVEVIG